MAARVLRTRAGPGEGLGANPRRYRSPAVPQRRCRRSRRSWPASLAAGSGCWSPKARSAVGRSSRRVRTAASSPRTSGSVEPDESERQPRRLRADAQRNVAALLEAAKNVFATSGVDAPAKEITDLAGVGIGTLYRHFPRRSELVAAVMQRA